MQDRNASLVSREERVAGWVRAFEKLRPRTTLQHVTRSHGRERQAGPTLFAHGSVISGRGWDSAWV
jgi:hypothetical protein